MSTKQHSTTCDPSVTVTVMYAPWVDWRAEQAHCLRDTLAASPYISNVELHANSKDRQIWDDARECWLAGTQMDGTHHIVMQDDVKLCESFGQAAYNAISALPNRNICFYGTRKVFAEALADGYRWVRYNGGFWGQCPCIPTMWIEEAIEFGDYYTKDDFQADDCRLSLWNELDGQYDTWVTVPQLVEHLGSEDSARGSIPPGGQWTAGVFVEDTSLSPTEIDWSRQLTDSPRQNTSLQVNRRGDKFRIDRLKEDGYIASE